MVTRNRSYAALAVGLPISFLACSVDTRPLTVGVPPPATITIATFENGTARPEDPRFQPFQFYSWGPALEDLPPGAFVTSPIVRPGHDSNFALGLNWHLIDVSDGAPSLPGVGVRTVVNGFIDLSAYSRFTFGKRYVATGGCLSVRDMTVTFSCGEHNTAFVASTLLTSTWSNAVLDFSDFSEGPYPGPNGTARSTCFSVIDDINFSVQMVLADGQCGAGELSLDDLSIRPSSGMVDGSDGGIDSASETAPPVVCQGMPPASPLITTFSDAIAGMPITFGAAPNITGQTAAWAAPGLTPPALSIVTAGTGTSALHVLADPGGATDSLNMWLGFGLTFDNCIDASAFNAVTFTTIGDFGNCPIRFAATSSQNMSPHIDPKGSCTLATCVPPSFSFASTGTTIVRFSDLSGGSPSVVDPTALIGLQWQMETPVGVGCKADFIVDDLSFVSVP